MSLEQIIAGVSSNDPTLQLQCTQAARKMLSRERNPPIDVMIEAGLIPHMVPFLFHNDK